MSPTAIQIGEKVYHEACVPESYDGEPVMVDLVEGSEETCAAEGCDMLLSDTPTDDPNEAEPEAQA